MTEASYRARLPDLAFYQEAVACQSACPVRTDSRGYVSAIGRGQYEQAYLIARETNPFASTCGWVCGAPCEAACRRGTIDAPLAIRALKRFVNDRFGVYLGEAGESRLPPAWPGYAGPTNAFDLGNTTLPTSRSGLMAERRRSAAAGRRVAVVGSGPAGLSCAHDLAVLGHEVTIYEAAAVAGGMLRLGIPEYRLPREIIELEIQAILALGPRMKLGQGLGRDFQLADLRSEFEAIFLAIGTYQSRRLHIEGEDLDGVLRAVDFLINVNLHGYNLDLGRRILVIGGGNVAMDVARTAARLGHPVQSGGDLEVTLDVARAVRRLGATQKVDCLVVEARSEMLADATEVMETEAEGIRIHNRVAPKRILGDGRAIAVETLAVSRAFDEDGRFNPQLLPNSERVWPCDSVIVSIGQTGALDWIRPEDGLRTTGRGTLEVDPATLATSAPGVFAGGDIAFGPRLIVNAVADGQKAARGIHSYLQGEPPRRMRRGYFTPIARKAYAALGPARGYLRHGRHQPPFLPVDRRIGVTQVELAYDQAAARREGKRCLICSLNPVFDGDLCVLCNGCVDACPTDCLKLVPVSDLETDEVIRAVVRSRGAGTAMLLDPTRCIRCGLCAARCPTGAVEMESFRFSEEVVLGDAAGFGPSIERDLTR